MTTTLCTTFQQLASRTYKHLNKGAAVAHQPLEETFTDINILELKASHPTEIFCETYSKPAEGVNGADWEWWLTNPSMTSWLCLRIQAKVHHLATGKFEHLHYKSGKPATYQLDRLAADALKHKRVPLYCLYMRPRATPPATFRRSMGCKVGSKGVRSYGCSLASVPFIKSLRTPTARRGIKDVIAGSIPWHCLVCCGDNDPENFPRSALTMLTTLATRWQGKAAIGILAEIKPDLTYLQDKPPEYVTQLLEAGSIAKAPKGVARVMVVRPSLR